MKTLILCIGLIVTLPFEAFAIGEVFQVETSGTEWCGDFDHRKFNRNNNLDLWVRIESETEFVVSTTAEFQPGTFFSIFGNTFLTGNLTAKFVASQAFADDAFLSVQGIAHAAKTGAVKSVSGTFIENGVFDAACFSAGKFVSVQRMQ